MTGTQTLLVRRDPLPLVIAGATAAISAGLLALAIAGGWLGPDVGRGANFCEAAWDWPVRQPANTFSNVGFIVSGLLIAWHSGHHGRTDRRLSLPGHLATLLASVVVLLGPASAAMHATQSNIGGRLDMLSMYLIASFAIAYAAMRWSRGRIQHFAATFVTGIVLCEIVGGWSGEVPVVMTSGNAVFGLLLVAAVGLEIVIMRRRETHAQRWYAYASVACILTAFLIWNAARAGLCDPHSLIQGHAIWHILCAAAAYFLYRYYASERKHAMLAP